MGQRRRRKFDEAKESRWRGLIEDQRKSGLSIRAFCKSRALSEPSFYGWRREIAKRDGERTTSRSTRSKNGSSTAKHRKSSAPRKSSSSQQAAFVPLAISLSAAQSNAAVEILFSGDRRVRVLPGFDVETLARVVAVLENRPC